VCEMLGRSVILSAFLRTRCQWLVGLCHADGDEWMHEEGADYLGRGADGLLYIG
jgi:hypothetical protein